MEHRQVGLSWRAAFRDGPAQGRLDAPATEFRFACVDPFTETMVVIARVGRRFRSAAARRRDQSAAWIVVSAVEPGVVRAQLLVLLGDRVGEVVTIEQRAQTYTVEILAVQRDVDGGRVIGRPFDASGVVVIRVSEIRRVHVW